MKKAFWILILPSIALSAYGWNMRAGLRFLPGLVYNRIWDTGYTGSSAFLLVSIGYEKIHLEAGMEAGYDNSGINLLFPLEAGLRFAKWKKLELFSMILFSPGLKLNRPHPYFLIATEANCLATVSLRPRFSVSGSIGPRFTISPAYEKT
ncbi:MAG: hypothetical protein GX640_03310, partial [Fibrobacter sp.]|nr:hypothetical protein [Fibrobacter sp.]